jgi:polygalacturonase
MKKAMCVLGILALLLFPVMAQGSVESGSDSSVAFPGFGDGKLTIQEVFFDESTQADWNMASAIVQSVQRPRIPTDVEFKVTDFGAVADGVSDALPAIQKAIDTATEAGGGKVVVPAGTYFCKGPVQLKSNVELNLAEGSKLLFSPDPVDFLPVVKTRWEGTELMGYSPLVYAYGQHDIALTGKGTIDGNAESTFHTWNKLQKNDQLQLRYYGAEGAPVEQRVFGEGTFLRPACIQINYCDRVLLEDYTVNNSPFWINHINCSNHVQVRGLTVESHNSNNDGVDVESSTYVIVEENYFRTGDDSVVIKSGRDYDGRTVGKPSKYIVVRKNDMGGEDGIALGSEMSGGIAYVFFDDNVMQDGVSAVRFKANLDRGATCEHVRVRNMRIANFENFIWFQLNYPGELGGNFPTIYKDLVFEDITMESTKNVFEAHAPKGYPLQDVMLRNVTIENASNPVFMLENVKNLVLDNVEINDQRLNGTMTSI